MKKTTHGRDARPDARSGAAPRTSWQPVEKWYDKSVGEMGHYYHQHVVIPGLMKLLALDKVEKPIILDLACGQGVLERHLPPKAGYWGFDIAPGLIHSAKEQLRSKLRHFDVADVTKPLPLEKNDFTHAVIILALQNIEHPEKVIANASRHLAAGGKIAIVLNHPCFRVPRQSSWEVDEKNKMRYRRINRYLSPLKVPIKMNPSQGEASAETWSFHHPLSDYTRWLHQEGFAVELIEEWASDKESSGKTAKSENLSRAEIPLFLTLLARKI